MKLQFSEVSLAISAESGSVIIDNSVPLLEGIVSVLPCWSTPRNKGRPAGEAKFLHYSGCGKVIRKTTF
jgi:hypothetical protein